MLAHADLKSLATASLVTAFTRSKNFEQANDLMTFMERTVTAASAHVINGSRLQASRTPKCEMPTPCVTSFLACLSDSERDPHDLASTLNRRSQLSAATRTGLR